MKVWYLQVIWQVRDSTIMSMQAIMPRAGKTMTNWLKNSGEKELEHLLNNRRVRNKLRQIKKLLMSWVELVLNLLKLMFQRPRPQRKLPKLMKELRMMAVKVAMEVLVVMPKKKKVKVMLRVTLKLMMVLLKKKTKMMRELVEEMQILWLSYQNSIPHKPLLKLNPLRQRKKLRKSLKRKLKKL